MKGYVTTIELATIMNRSRQWVYKQGHDNKWKSVLKNGTKQYKIKTLPEEIRHQIRAYRRGLDPAVEPKENIYLPEWKRKIAAARFRLLTLLDEAFKFKENIGLPKVKVIENFVGQYNRGEIASDILKQLGTKSARTIQRWFKDYNNSSDKTPVIALAPAYGKRKGKITLSEQAQDFIRSVYLRPRVEMNGNLYDIGQNQLSMMFVYRQYCRAVREMSANGEEVRPASYDTVRRFCQNISYREQVLYREGKKAYHDKIEIHAKRDYNTIDINEIWTSDGHAMNIMAKDTDGTLRRPVLVVIEDMRTRRIMGFEMQFTESSETVVNAVADAILTNECVVPDIFYIDNGKAFKNKYTMGLTRGKMLPGRRVPQVLAGENTEDQLYFQGVYAELGIRTSFARPYNSAAKGTIEKLWDFIDRNFSKQYPTYVGKDNQKKPEKLKEHIKDPNAIPTLEELRIAFRLWVDEVYNERPHRGHAMDRQSPNAIYAMASNLRTVPENLVAMAILRKEKRKVLRDGVRWNHWFYSDPKAEYVNYLGKSVYIAINPHDLTSVYVLDQNKNFLFKADRNQPVDLKADEATTMNQIRNRKRLQKNVKKLEDKKNDKLFIIRAQETAMDAEKYNRTFPAQAAPALLTHGELSVQKPREKLIHLLGEK